MTASFIEMGMQQGIISRALHQAIDRTAFTIGFRSTKTGDRIFSVFNASDTDGTALFEYTVPERVRGEAMDDYAARLASEVLAGWTKARPLPPAPKVDTTPKPLTAAEYRALLDYASQDKIRVPSQELDGKEPLEANLKPRGRRKASPAG